MTRSTATRPTPEAPTGSAWMKLEGTTRPSAPALRSGKRRSGPRLPKSERIARRALPADRVARALLGDQWVHHNCLTSGETFSSAGTSHRTDASENRFGLETHECSSAMAAASASAVPSPRSALSSLRLMCSPVETHKLGVHGLVGPALGGLDEGEDLVEGGGARERRRLSHRWRDNLPAGPVSLSHHITAPSETTAATPR